MCLFGKAGVVEPDDTNNPNHPEANNDEDDARGQAEGEEAEDRASSGRNRAADIRSRTDVCTNACTDGGCSKLYAWLQPVHPSGSGR